MRTEAPADNQKKRLEQNLKKEYDYENNTAMQLLTILEISHLLNIRNRCKK